MSDEISPAVVMNIASPAPVSRGSDVKLREVA
jgi:hypothetical protein